MFKIKKITSLILILPYVFYGKPRSLLQTLKVIRANVIYRIDDTLNCFPSCVCTQQNEYLYLSLAKSVKHDYSIGRLVGQWLVGWWVNGWWLIGQ